MKSYLINGGVPLKGSIQVNGAKNSALGIIAASIISNETSVIKNIPNVTDIKNLLDIIEIIGGQVERIDNHTISINGNNINPNLSINYDCVKKMRASYYLLGALLGKYKVAKVALPGGCEIGSRPLDQHFKGFKALGATIKLENGTVIAEAEELKGNNIYLDIPSVGATVNIMLAATFAKGKTQIINVAKEPHVVDIANFLNSMGAKIKGAGTDILEIEGVNYLHKTTYTVIPDQIEVGTFMLASVITNGDIIITNVIPKHLGILIYKLEQLGSTIELTDNTIRVIGERKNGINVITSPYPGFPTDLQPQMAITCGVTNKNSFIKETIFEKRYCYVDEVSRMGARMKVSSDSLIIEGIPEYQNAIVEAPDLRAGAALVLAALNAKGTSVVENISYIERGYEDFHIKLNSLGAEIKIIEENGIKDIKRLIKKGELL